ncbi:hypothetical protein CL619_04090 [archaeon]|nr:hypothetical protein [archaeon]|tara:strand:- start:4139 stop:6250 length:2112 start_codon:yes stop_codon:yes gene_type:complete
MSNIFPSDLEARILNNQIIARTRDSGLVRKPIATRFAPEFRHTTIKYITAGMELAEAGSEFSWEELWNEYARVIGCQETGSELAEFTKKIDHWNSLWFMYSALEFAAEVLQADREQFYRRDVPDNSFTSETFLQGRLFGTVFGGKALLKFIEKTAPNFSKASSFRSEEIDSEDTDRQESIRSLIHFPENLNGELMEVLRVRDPTILQRTFDIYQDQASDALQYDTWITEGVFNYGTNRTLGEFGHIEVSPEELPVGTTKFYAAFPAGTERATAFGKALLNSNLSDAWVLAKSIGNALYDKAIMWATLPKRHRELALTFDARSEEVSNGAALATRLNDELEIQAAKLSEERAQVEEQKARADAAERRIELLEGAGLRHDAIASVRDGLAFHQSTIFSSVCNNLLAAYQAANSGDPNFTDYINAFDKKLKFRFRGKQDLQKSDLESRLSGKISEKPGRWSITYEQLVKFHEQVLERLEGDISNEAYLQLQEVFSPLHELLEHRQSARSRIKDFESRGRGGVVAKEFPLENMLTEAEALARKKLGEEWVSEIHVDTDYVPTVKSKRTFVDNIYDLIKNSVEAGATKVDLVAADFAEFSYDELYGNFLIQDGELPIAYICLKDNGGGYPHAKATTAEINDYNGEITNRSTRAAADGGGEGTKNLHDLITTDFHRGKLKGLYHAERGPETHGTEFYLFFYSKDLATLK